MVTPIHIISIGLGTAFLMGIAGKLGKNFVAAMMLIALAVLTLISGHWLLELYNGRAAEIIYTAGFKPPFSVNLKMGIYEAFFTTLINIVGLLGGLYMLDILRKQGKNAMIVFLVLIMGLNVIIMTRDLFNLFVFLEVVSIATAGLIVLNNNLKSVSAGFKYMIATGIIAGLFLLGIIFAYYFGGSLNLDDIIASNLGAFKGGIVVIFLLVISVVLELKPFPANGWGIDVYQGANPGLNAIMSAGIASASFFVLYKVLQVGGQTWYYAVAVTGLITFVGSNLIGIMQGNSKRLLGYSSVGQIGLLMIVLGFGNIIGGKLVFVAASLLLTHYFAKAGLFWLAGIINVEDLKDWSVIRKKPLMLLFLGTFMFALIGMPPFPSFFGKWELIMQLSANGQIAFVVLILLGSLFEAVYLFRWFGYATKLKNENQPDYKFRIEKMIPVALFAIALYVSGYFASKTVEGGHLINLIPLLFVVTIFAIDFLPAFLKNLFTIAGLGYYAYDLAFNRFLPENDTLRLIFTGIFIAGGVIMLIPGFAHKGKRTGFYPLMALMFAGLGGLIEASTTLGFFFAWEIMTISSYLLILRGEKAMKPALNYILFSIGGAYFMLAGFGMAYAGTGSTLLTMLGIGGLATITFVLIAIGFMSKIATMGLHIWLPGSYAEAEDDVTPVISSILIKSGIFGFIILLTSMGFANPANYSVTLALGWIGAISAIIGNLLAIFQEDVKKLLAYSSVGVMGYILFAISLNTNLGWTTALIYAIIHFLYKGLLFLAIAGVIYRTKTRNIYEMGGLIKKMPWSFIAVLIGIITLAGMPPLAGFSGKWLFYNAVILKGWYIQGTMVFFAGIIAFLYCFKLIHNIFLGPLKDNHRKIKETNGWYLLPQFMLMGGIMVLSVYPKIVLEPISAYLGTIFPGEGLVWDGLRASTSLGYWNPTLIMNIVMGMFAVLLGFLLFSSRKAQKVEMFNIVYQAEQPHRPETTHYAHNMFAHYNKALGFLASPRVTNFWNGLSNIVNGGAESIRKVYTGNGQTYALYVVIFIVLFYLLTMGGF